MAAPESIKAWYHFPACMVTVGQSVIWAMVMTSSLGSPLWECVLGEGAPSLNHSLSHFHFPLNCNNLREDHQWKLV